MGPTNRGHCICEAFIPGGRGSVRAVINEGRCDGLQTLSLTNRRPRRTDLRDRMESGFAGLITELICGPH